MADDFLRLPSIRVTTVEEPAEGSYQVSAVVDGVPASCEACARRPVYAHGSYEQRVVDVPHHGRPTIIILSRRRYRCQACGKTFSDQVPDLDPKRLATRRLVTYIRQHCLRRTFADMAREVGLDDQTIRNVFDDLVAQLKATTRFETPRFLGLDEIKVIGRSRAVVTNVEQNTLYDMLLDRNKTTLVAYFRQLPEREKVEVLTMDMWSVYAQVALTCFPGVPIVIDRFHVERMANDALEKVRKTVRKGLTTHHRLKLKNDRHLLLTGFDRLSAAQQDTCRAWFEVYPLLGQAHAAKEGFAQVYRQRNRADAERVFDQWQAELPEAILPYFRELVHAVGTRRRDVFNFFDYPITNAYTESINNLIKLENRLGRGYSFEVLRARMLYDQKATKAGSTSLRARVRRQQSDMPPGAFGRMTSDSVRPSPQVGQQEKDVVICYGAHIPTLVRLLEEGHFE